MTQTRSITDRLMMLVQPRLVADYAPPPYRIDEGLWVLDRRLRMPGGPVLPARTTILVLSSGDLVVVSPPPVEAGGLDALDAIGPVRHVVAPNSFHYLYAAGFLARYPGASFYAAPGLFARVDGLPPGNEVTAEREEEWSAEIDHAILVPTRGFSEVALYHRRSATLILTDVAFHMVRFESAWERFAWRASGVPAGFGPSRTARTLLLRDRKAAGEFLTRVAAWPFRRVLVAHGDALETNAAAEFRRAFAAYLPNSRP